MWLPNRHLFLMIDLVDPLPGLLGGFLSHGGYSQSILISDVPVFSGTPISGNPHCFNLVGGARTILKNMKVNGKDDIPYIAISYGKKCSEPPTSNAQKSHGFLPRDVQNIPPPSANLSGLGVGPIRWGGTPKIAIPGGNSWWVFTLPILDTLHFFFWLVTTVMAIY